MKILIALYGVGRGVEYSEGSIKKYIIEPIVSMHETKIIYVRKNIPEFIYKRNKSGAPFESDYMEFEEGEHFNFDAFLYSKKFYDKHQDNYNSNKNLIYQLSKVHMLSKIVNMNHYDRIVFCRDDLIFYNPINWSNVFFLAKEGLFTTMWHWNAGISERFVVTNSKYAEIICNKLFEVKESIKYFGTLNGEYLQLYIVKKYNIPIYIDNIKFSRIRYNNEIANEKFYFSFWRPFEFLNILFLYFKTHLYLLFFKH